MDSRHDVFPVDEYRLAERCTQGDMQYRPLLRRVDLVAAKHCRDTARQTARFGECEKQAQRLIGDAILRIVEIESGGLGGETLTT